MTFVLADPTEWWLEPELESQIAFQQQSYRYSSSNSYWNASYWNAYLNHLCLHTVLAWLQTEYVQTATPGFAAIDHVAIWEVVNGSRLGLGNAQNNTQVVVIPSEAIDSSELEVPQEWIDIPSWAADYYLAVQVREGNTGEGNTGTIALESDAPLPLPSVRVWGYASHHQIKTAGRYDAIDRTYCLDSHLLNRDMSTFWVTLQFCPTVQTRTVVDSLPELSNIQAANLIQRLADPALRFPRLAVPFGLWGALLERGDWRQQLYQRRSQLDTSNYSERVRLSDWLQNQVSAGWRSLEEMFGFTSAELAMGMRSNINSDINSDAVDAIRAKSLILGNTPDAPTVVLVLHLTPEPDGRISILVQLYPEASHTLLPAEITLSLLSNAGEILQSTLSQSQDDYIQLRRFRCPIGTQFSVQVAFQAYSHVELFMV